MYSEEFVLGIIKGEVNVNKNIRYTKFNKIALEKVSAALGEREYLTIPEAGLWLKTSRETVYRMIKRGDIVAYSLSFGGCKYRIDVAKTKELFMKTAKKKLMF